MLKPGGMMTGPSTSTTGESGTRRVPSASLRAERVAYWYFRLNGCLQIENFVVHPERGSEQRTEADLLGVRFPRRSELGWVDAQAMQDDIASLAFHDDRIDALIVGIKARQPCSLNGPWSKREKANVQRTLSAMGWLAPSHIAQAAEELYARGEYTGKRCAFA